ncbi:gelsolin-related protein [Tieghemostelium lacteum]|uniref:Gelsolin-related protein n=1 Tax=Tieghemostelium lacteum TaxID=361077 RepID=A0A151ZK86_TIELA|nr:gelsolin-related protein [Tieghemostelium lacteum]|eukprot:KYQ94319.1 gelsolin-related protein [Tieghemostelium lacteum]
MEVDSHDNQLHGDDNKSDDFEQQVEEQQSIVEKPIDQIELQQEQEQEQQKSISFSLSTEQNVSNELEDSQQNIQETVEGKNEIVVENLKQEEEIKPASSKTIQSSVSLHIDAKLIQVCGQEPYHYIIVPLSKESLNLEDVFIMQSDAYMFVWASPNVNSTKKAKAIQMAQKLKAEIGCERAVQVLEFGEEHPTFLYCLGLPKGQKLKVTKENNELFQLDEDDQVLEPEFYLFKLATVEDKLNFIPIDEPEIKQDMFESNSCYIIDCEHEIFVWQGKNSTKAERECSIPLAKKIQATFDRPETFINTIRMEFDGSESCLFKSKFKSGWKDKVQPMQSYLGLGKKKAELSFDIASMHVDKEVPTIQLSSNDHKGKLLVWNCGGGGKWQKVEEDDFGIFFSNKSYVCHFIYKPENKNSIRSVIFYWEGSYSNHRNYISYKFGLYKDIQKKMQALQSDDPVEYRITQNKEPLEFIQLFGTDILVLNDDKLQPKPMMFQVRGGKNGCRGTQLQEISSLNLNSMDSFVFIFPEKLILVWYGRGSNEEERILANELYTFLPPEFEAPLKEFEEGQESEAFWKLIGGKFDYPSIDITDGDESSQKESLKPKIKLFLCTENSGIFKADEVKPFSQLDLNHEENVILDVHNHIFVWKGSNTTESKSQQTLALVKEYIQSFPQDSSRHGKTINFTTIEQGNESSLFKSYFISWKPAAPKVFVDPRIKIAQTHQENVKLELELKKQQQQAQQAEPVKVEEQETKTEDTKVVDESVKVDVETKTEDTKVDEEPVTAEESVKVEETKIEETKIEEEIVKVDESASENVNVDESTSENVKQELNTIEETSETTTTTTSTNTPHKKNKKNKNKNKNQNITTTTTTEESPSINITPPITIATSTSSPSPMSISTSGDLLFSYEPFHSPTSSPKQSRKGKKTHKNKRNNLSGSQLSNMTQLSLSPQQSRSIETTYHLDSSNTITPQKKNNKKFHNRTSSFNH